LYYEEVYVIPQGTITLQEGDLLCYDVQLLDEYGGFGGVDIACGYEKDGLGICTLRDDTMSRDQNFLQCHPTVNLAGLCLNQWFAREVFLSSVFVEHANQNDLRVLIAVDLPNAADLAGVTVNCQYDNIRIVRDGEVIYTIFADRENAIPEEPVYYFNLDGQNAHVTTDVFINYDVVQPEPEPTEPQPTEPKATDPKPNTPKPTEPADTEKPAPINSGLIIGGIAAVVVIAVVVVIVVIRKKKTA